MKLWDQSCACCLLFSWISSRAPMVFIWWYWSNYLTSFAVVAYNAITTVSVFNNLNAAFSIDNHTLNYSLNLASCCFQKRCLIPLYPFADMYFRGVNRNEKSWFCFLFFVLPSVLSWKQLTVAVNIVDLSFKPNVSCYGNFFYSWMINRIIRSCLQQVNTLNLW